MSDYYSPDTSNDNDEPQKKKIKYEEDFELYKFQIGYLTKKGYILLENKNLLGNDSEFDYLENEKTSLF